MITITNVVLPSNVKYGTAFKVTVSFQSNSATDPTDIDVTPLQHITVAPEAFTIQDLTTGNQSFSLTISVQAQPAPTVVMLRFSIGPSEFTAYANAS